MGQRLGPVAPETPGRWVDPGRRTRALSYGQAPLHAASRRPCWVFLLEGPDRGRTVPARKGVGVASGVRLGRRPVGPPGVFGAKVGALARSHRSPGSAEGPLKFLLTPSFPSISGGCRCRLRSDDHPRGLHAPCGLRVNCPEAQSQNLKVIAEFSPPPRALQLDSAVRSVLTALRRCRVSRSRSHPCNPHTWH